VHNFVTPIWDSGERRADCLRVRLKTRVRCH